MLLVGVFDEVRGVTLVIASAFHTFWFSLLPFDLLVAIAAKPEKRDTPSREPMLSATASRNSHARPREGSAPWSNSMHAPRAIPMSSMVDSQPQLCSGRLHSHKKVNPPNKTKCTHLSIKGASTLGMSFAGIKQPIKISKVHSIAMYLACFL